MKRASLAVVLITSVLSLAGDGHCAPLYDVVADKMIERFALDTATTRFEFLRSQLPNDSVDANRVRLQPLFEREPVGLVSVLVLIDDGSGEERRGQISMRVRKYTEVVVTTAVIKDNDMLTPERFSIQMMDVTSLREQPLTSLGAILGSRAKRNLAVGRVLTAEAIETVPDIEVGREVTITFAGDAFTITTKGQAMQSGRIGDVIKVRNAVSGKTVTGRVTGAGEVHAEL